MKKILLFARDTGGANTIIPLVSLLESKGHKVLLYGKDLALSRYTFFGLVGTDLLDIVEKVTPSSLEQFLKDERPDFIVTGTSAEDMTEKYLWNVANLLNIPSFAIVDNWMNYGVRFSNYGIYDVSKYYLNKKHIFLPSRILVMDEYAKREMLNEGFPENKIIVSGQPYFDLVRQKKIDSLQDCIKKKRGLLDIDAFDFVIVFASQSFSTDYPRNGSFYYWGFTEHTIFTNLVEIIQSIIANFSAEIAVIIKLHPSDDPDSYNNLIHFFSDNKIHFIVEQNVNSWDLILSADLVCGMTSMFLLESAILGKPTMSIQIGLCRENTFIMDRMGFLKSILNKEDLFFLLEKIIKKKYRYECKFEVIENASEKVVFEIENFLKRISNDRTTKNEYKKYSTSLGDQWREKVKDESVSNV